MQLRQPPEMRRRRHVVDCATAARLLLEQGRQPHGHCGCHTLESVACSWHSCGMPRTRISTTVDRDLLASARDARSGTTDAQLIDEALAALLARDRAAEIDAAYQTAYDSHPIDEPDEWGDLASFRDEAAAT